MARKKKKYISQDVNSEENITIPESQPEPSVDGVSEENAVEESTVETPNEETFSEPEVQTQAIVYLGGADKATVIGAVTGQKYSFYKDVYGMPLAVDVDERDSSAILALRTDACCGKEPQKLYQTKVEWDLEIQQAKKLNS